MLGSKEVCKCASPLKRTDSQPLPAQEQRIFFRCLRDTHSGQRDCLQNSGTPEGRRTRTEKTSLILPSGELEKWWGVFSDLESHQKPRGLQRQVHSLTHGCLRALLL